MVLLIFCNLVCLRILLILMLCWNGDEMVKFIFLRVLIIGGMIECGVSWMKDILGLF